MSSTKGRPTEPIPAHRILREVYRHYLEYRQLVSDTGEHVIEHGYFIYGEPYEDEDGKERQDITGRVLVSISFWDLFTGLDKLAPRKKEAVFWNVIMDQKQKDVAKRMGITTVSVGQYVEHAMLQLSERYYAEGKMRVELRSAAPTPA
jgi:DNA-directed RNA polymerase specialized sigma24 family protein